jgi:hypothetical protein
MITSPKWRRILWKTVANTKDNCRCEDYCLIKFLNFTIDIMDGIGVIGAHIREMGPHTIRKPSVCVLKKHTGFLIVCVLEKGIKELKKHILLLETLIHYNINSWGHSRLRNYFWVSNRKGLFKITSHAWYA